MFGGHDLATERSWPGHMTTAGPKAAAPAWPRGVRRGAPACGGAGEQGERKAPIAGPGYRAGPSETPGLVSNMPPTGTVALGAGPWKRAPVLAWRGDCPDTAGANVPGRRPQAGGGRPLTCEAEAGPHRPRHWWRRRAVGDRRAPLTNRSPEQRPGRA